MASNPEHANEVQAVASRLREAREVLGLTQEDVATALNIQRTSVHAFETGKRNVSVVEIRKLARLYKRSVGWLVGDEESADISGQALYRATESLSDSDREQVLAFARFLAAAERKNPERNELK